MDADWSDVEAITALIYTAANYRGPDVADSTFLLLELLSGLLHALVCRPVCWE